MNNARLARNEWDRSNMDFVYLEEASGYWCSEPSARNRMRVATYLLRWLLDFASSTDFASQRSIF